MTVSLSDVTEAVVDELVDAGLTVGRGETPTDGGWDGVPGQSPFTEFCIVWRIGGKDIVHRDIDGNWNEARVTVHVRTVGATSDEAEDLLDVVIDTLTGAVLDVADASHFHTTYDTSIGPSRDDDVNPPVFFDGAYFRFWLQDES